jgi:hypothetical protein
MTGEEKQFLADHSVIAMVHFEAGPNFEAARQAFSVRFSALPRIGERIELEKYSRGRLARSLRQTDWRVVDVVHRVVLDRDVMDRAHPDSDKHGEASIEVYVRPHKSRWTLSASPAKTGRPRGTRSP